MTSYAQSNLETKLMDLTMLAKTLEFDKGVPAPYSAPEVQKRLQDFSTKELSGAIRRFLRELPEPLIPTNVYDEFIDMGKSQIDSDAILMMDKLITNSLNTHHSRYEVLWLSYSCILKFGAISIVSPNGSHCTISPRIQNISIFLTLT